MFSAAVDDSPAGVRSPRRRSLLVLSLGLVLSLLLALLVHDRESTQAEAALRRGAEQLVLTVSQDLARALAAPEYLVGLFHASEHVSQAEFQRFAAILQRSHPEIQTLLWAERVPLAQLEQFAAERARLKPGFQVRELAPDGRLRPVSPLPELYVASLLAPEGARGFLGFTPSTPPSARSEALARAVATDALAVSGRAPLLNHDGLEPAVVSYAPVAADAPGQPPRGVVGVTFRLAPLIGRALARDPGRTLQAAVFDVTAPEHPVLLYADHLASEPAAIIASGLRPVDLAGSVSLALEVGGRHWQVHVMPEAPAGMAAWLITLLAGLALSAGAAAMLARGGRLGSAAALEGATPSPAVAPDPADMAPYRHLVEEAPDLIATCTPDGRLLYLSPSCRRILGWSPEEMVGRPLFDFIHPEDVFRTKLVQERYQDMAVHAPGVYLSTHRVRRADGGYAQLEVSVSVLVDAASGRAREVLAIARDVAGRAPEMDQVRESERRYRAAFESAPLPMVIAEALDGRLVRVNTAMCDFLGYSRAELREMTMLDLTHPADLAVSRDIEAGLKRGESRFVLDKRYLRKGGATVRARAEIAVLRDDGGRPRFLVAQAIPLDAEGSATGSLTEPVADT